MPELNSTEQSILSAMNALGATKDASMKTANDIAKKSNRSKGLVINTLVALTTKSYIKRVVKEKAAGYYIIKNG